MNKRMHESVLGLLGTCTCACVLVFEHDRYAVLLANVCVVLIHFLQSNSYLRTAAKCISVFTFIVSLLIVMHYSPERIALLVDE